MSGENAWTTGRKTKQNELGDSEIEVMVLSALKDNFMPISALRTILVRTYPQFELVLGNPEKFKIITDTLDSKGKLDHSAYQKGIAMRPTEYFGTKTILSSSTIKTGDNYG